MNISHLCKAGTGVFRSRFCSHLRFGKREMELKPPEGRQTWLQYGSRLIKIRGEASQAQFAPKIGVHKNTLGHYERGTRELGADALRSLVYAGWNANWVLTGQEPERLDHVAAAPQSQNERPERVRLAVQLLREAEDAAGRPARWTPEQQGEATAILVRLLEIGTATAEVLSIAKQQIRLFSGDRADGRHGSGAEGVGR